MTGSFDVEMTADFSAHDDVNSGGWIRVRSGRTVNPLTATPEDIELEDIAHALAMMCRFNGHSEIFYSVAAHSVMVSYLMAASLHSQNVSDPALVMWALLHDAAEAYLADIPTPLKRHTWMRFSHEDLLEKFGVSEARLLNVIVQALAPTILDRYPVEPVAVKHPDMQALKAEAIAFMGGVETANAWGLESIEVPKRFTIDKRIASVAAPEHARQMFINRFRELEFTLKEQAKSE